MNKDQVLPTKIIQLAYDPVPWTVGLELGPPQRADFLDRWRKVRLHSSSYDWNKQA
jgi:hypothetical protein